MLTLFDELFLLSIHEAKGVQIKTTTERLKFGLVGALLAELALLGKIQNTDNHRLQVVDQQPISDDELLTETLDLLAAEEKVHKFGYWLNLISQKSDKTRKQITKKLIQKSVFTQDDDRLVWVIPFPLKTATKASAKSQLIKRLRGIVLAQDEFQKRDIALLSLLRACGLLERAFLDDERKMASRAINEMLFSQAINDSVTQTIQEIETAISSLVEED